MFEVILFFFISTTTSRYTLNITASVFIAIGALFDLGVWYYVKDLKIFDEEVKEFEMKVVQHEEEVNSIKDLEA